MTASNPQPARKSLLKTMLLAGLLVGTLDICAAFIQAYIVKGTRPVMVLRSIATGLLGKDALSGGMGAAVLGLLCHFLIAYGFTIFFFLVYPRIVFLRKNILIAAVIYAVFMYAISMFVIVRLSRIGAVPFHFNKALVATGILVVAIGLPLALFARRFYKG